MTDIQFKIIYRLLRAIFWAIVYTKYKDETTFPRKQLGMAEDLYDEWLMGKQSEDRNGVVWS